MLYSKSKEFFLFHDIIPLALILTIGSIAMIDNIYNRKLTKMNDELQNAILQKNNLEDRLVFCDQKLIQPIKVPPPPTGDVYFSNKKYYYPFDDYRLIYDYEEGQYRWTDGKMDGVIDIASNPKIKVPLPKAKHGEVLIFNGNPNESKYFQGDRIHKHADSKEK